MSFEEEVFLTILDKGLLAIVLAVVAGLIKWWLQRDQAQKDLIKEVAPLRAAAYAKFWGATEPFRRTDAPQLTEDVLSTAQKDLNRIYFDEGGAMYLSHEAASRLTAARQKLKDGAEEDEIRKQFSRFRTQLKRDLLIYTKREADSPLRIDDSGSG